MFDDDISFFPITYAIRSYEMIRKDSTILFAKGNVSGTIRGLSLYVNVNSFPLATMNISKVYFVICSILWGMIIDKKKPDKYEVIASLVAVLGAAIIFYTPR